MPGKGQTGLFKRHKYSPHAHPLVREMFDVLNARRIPMYHLARRAGVASNTLSVWKHPVNPEGEVKGERIAQWKFYANPQLLAFEAVLNTLGYKLKIVPVDEK